MCIGGRNVSPSGPVPFSSTVSTCASVRLGSPASGGALSAQFAMLVSPRVALRAFRHFLDEIFPALDLISRWRGLAGCSLTGDISCHQENRRQQHSANKEKTRHP